MGPSVGSSAGGVGALHSRLAAARSRTERLTIELLPVGLLGGNPVAVGESGGRVKGGVFNGWLVFVVLRRWKPGSRRIPVDIAVEWRAQAGSIRPHQEQGP